MRGRGLHQDRIGRGILELTHIGAVPQVQPQVPQDRSWLRVSHMGQRGGVHMAKSGVSGSDKGVKVKDAGGARKTPIIRKGS